MIDNRTTGLRIGDAERDAAGAALSDHFAAGRLSRDEFDERLDQVWQACTGADLAPLFDDLPSGTSITRSVYGTSSRVQSRGDLRADWRARSADTRFGPRRGGPPPFFPIMLIALIISVVSVSNGHAPWPLFVLAGLWFFRVLGHPAHGAVDG